jgi:hypothetical protein
VHWVAPGPLHLTLRSTSTRFGGIEHAKPQIHSLLTSKTRSLKNKNKTRRQCERVDKAEDGAAASSKILETSDNDNGKRVCESVQISSSWQWRQVLPRQPATTTLSNFYRDTSKVILSRCAEYACSLAEA